MDSEFASHMFKPHALRLTFRVEMTRLSAKSTKVLKKIIICNFYSLKRNFFTIVSSRWFKVKKVIQIVDQGKSLIYSNTVISLVACIVILPVN